LHRSLWDANLWHTNLWNARLWHIAFLCEGLNGGGPSQEHACGQAQGQKDSHAVPQAVPLASLSPRPVSQL